MNSNLKNNNAMRFEFDYDADTDQITIVYDGVFVLKADFDGDRPIFRNFEKLQDEEIETMLKNLCRAAYEALV
jgi:hypothetical protein